MAAPRDQIDVLRDRAKLYECLPTFDEMLEIEYVLQEKQLNMVTDFARLIEHLRGFGLARGLSWLTRCQVNNFAWPVAYSIAMEEFERKRGSRRTWIDDEVRQAVNGSKGKAMRIELERLDEGARK